MGILQVTVNNRLINGFKEDKIRYSLSQKTCPVALTMLEYSDQQQVIKYLS